MDGTVGLAAGAAAEIPIAVITSVQGYRGPSISVQQPVVVGEPLPGTVELRTVPSHTEYRYAIVNDQRVIADPRTRRVIRIIDQSKARGDMIAGSAQRKRLP